MKQGLFRKDNKKKLCGRGLKRRLTAFFLAAGFLMSSVSCGKTEETPPELITPSAVTDSYRPVTRRDIGEVYIYTGSVVPESYPVFTEKGISLSEIDVSIGDYVEEGQLIAKGDTSYYDETIANLRSQIEFLNYSRQNSEAISKKVEEKMVYTQNAAIAVNDFEGSLEQSTEIYNEEEDRRYMLEKIDSDIADMNRRINDLTKQKNKLLFTAPHSGYITFIKDVSATSYVDANENIAVISDYDDLYIETSDLRIDDGAFKKCEVFYTYYGGQKIMLSEYEFTMGEVSYAKTMGGYPFARFKADKLPMSMGTMVLIYASRNVKENVLAIGRDSFYLDGETIYCNVVDEQGNREKRNIEVGISDKNYIEVKSGLSEGEFVLYDNKSPMPVKYSEYDVELTDYEEEYSSDILSLQMTENTIYVAPMDAVFKGYTSTVSGTPASAGDALCTIKTVVGKGDIADIKNLQIDNDKNHKDTIDGLNEQLNNLNAALEEARVAELPPASETDALEESLFMEDKLKTDIYMTEKQIDMENYRYNFDAKQLKKDLAEKSIGSDTDGEIVIKAEKDGIFGRLELKNNTTVRKGQYLLTICGKGKDVMKIVMPRSMGAIGGFLPPAALGRDIKYVIDGKEYKGKSIGQNGNPEKYYLFTRDGKEHLTHSEKYTEGVTETFFAEFDGLKLDGDVKGEVFYKGASFENVVTVPTKAVYSETNSVTGESKNYVWKVTEFGLSKQFVLVYQPGTQNSVRLIMDGISAGDKIAVED